jgi:hypothetical protein
MKKSLTLIMTIAVLGGFIIIIFMNIAALLGVIPSRYLSPNEVRGMAVEHNQLLYTLNFAQQNALIEIFNRSIPVDKKSVEERKATLKKPLEIQKIVIYRFNAPNIEITPVTFVAKTHSVSSSDEAGKVSLVFLAPDWNANQLLEEAAIDSLYKILINSYDP